ncbi:MAG: chromosome segregation protein SMC [Leptolyngbya sp.]|nr:MAG: chromosome segregation protein SMC [Leptolyngbya sp.]
MDGYRFIHSLTLKNFLSYGSEGETIELEPLNVIIGPNASGKSNLIEAIKLFRALPQDIHRRIRAGGGVSEWLWKGGNESPIAELGCSMNFSIGDDSLSYLLKFTSSGQKTEIIFERIYPTEDSPPNSQTSMLGDFSTRDFYRFEHGNAFASKIIDASVNPGQTSRREEAKNLDILSNESILSQLKDPFSYPEISYLAENFRKFYVYRELDVSRNSKIRSPQQTDLPEDFLLEDGSNLGLVINNLQHQIGSQFLIERFRDFYEDIEEIIPRIQGGTVQVFFREKGLRQPIPATRLSDGTLRYLCLLTILCHPNPPPLVCIEEPELGLHPDILPTVAKLLIAASQRTQLIVTTHSETLVSELSEMPEAVMVCERTPEGTHLQRLSPERLEKWLEKYSLGELWSMGEIGATRW